MKYKEKYERYSTDEERIRARREAQRRWRAHNPEKVELQEARLGMIRAIKAAGSKFMADRPRRWDSATESIAYKNTTKYAARQISSMSWGRKRPTKNKQLLKAERRRHWMKLTEQEREARLEKWRRYRQKNREKLAAKEKARRDAIRNRPPRKKMTEEERVARNAEWRAAEKKDKKAFLRRIKSGPCDDCGMEFDPVAMDLHHTRGKKLFELCRITTYGWAKILDELDKCDLLCAVCHRLRHKEEREVSEKNSPKPHC